MDLNCKNVIWSKGCLDHEYKLTETELVTSPDYILNMVQNKPIVWIRNTSMTNIKTDLDFLVDILYKIKKPFTLITTDGDRPVPSSYSNTTVHTLLESDKVLRWYTQNYDKSIIHDKLTYMPIGLDLHTKRWLINDSISEKVNYMVEQRMESRDKRKNVVLSDFHLHYSHPERRELHEKLKHNNKIYFLPNHVSFKEITNLYNTYQFVLSPRGNGLDCHRTWELFLAGAILITKTSSLDSMYIDNNLPVVILKDWNELDHDLETKLTQWYDKYIHLTSIVNIYPRMKFSYWLK